MAAELELASLSEEQLEQLHAAAIKAGAALAAFAAAFAEAMSKVDWDDIRVRLDRARAELEGSADGVH
jgi:hypothetical protein